MQAFAALVVLDLMKKGAPDIRIAKQRKGRRIRILAFCDKVEFLRAIKSQPAQIKLMAKTAKAEARQKSSNFSAVPKLENANNAQPPGKRAATRQPIPRISLIIFI